MTAEKKFQQTYKYEATYAGSNAAPELEGDYTAKAGFSVGDTIQVRISEDGKTITLRHSKPKLIACEQTHYHVVKDQDGWWNYLKPQEREDAVNKMNEMARQAALQSDLVSTATENLLQRLDPLKVKYQVETEGEVIP